MSTGLPTADTTCAICLSALTGSVSRGCLPCHHSCFCLHCIHRWAHTNTKCPMCGQRFLQIHEWIGLHPSGLILQVQDKIPVPEGDSELRAIERITCSLCGSGENWAAMLLCDRCNRGTHLACIGLSRLPEAQLWYCDSCLKEETVEVQVEQWREMRHLGRQSPDFVLTMTRTGIDVVLQTR